jgi:hypothetical protein
MYVAGASRNGVTTQTHTHTERHYEDTTYVVLLHLKELEHVGMPRLQVDGERALALAAALVDVVSGLFYRKFIKCSKVS